MDNKSVIEYCPVLYPKMKDFINFQDYVNQVERDYSDKCGMVKIIPPKKWQPTTKNYEELMAQVKIPGPIEQNAYGKGGIYELMLIQKKSMSLLDYRKKSQETDHVTDNLKANEIEDLFWKNISFSAPLYGADFQNSLFDKGVPWNLSEIETILNQCLPQKISGVNIPYLYVGCWKSMFGWHKEDLDLNAINFNHFGKTKFWYAINPKDGNKLEQFARQHFSDAFSRCNEYLRHKTINISPYLLKEKFKDQIVIHKAEHNPGEFIIVMSAAYHSGFNWGFNIAEAVNFGCLNWLKHFATAKPCTCTKDSVKIDRSTFLQSLLLTNYKAEPEVLWLKEYLEKEKELEQQKKIKNKIQSDNKDQQAQQKKDKKTKVTKIPVTKAIKKVKKAEKENNGAKKTKNSSRIIKRPEIFSY